MSGLLEAPSPSSGPEVIAYLDALEAAVRSNELEPVKTKISERPFVFLDPAFHEILVTRESFLHIAIRNDNLEITELLLSQGACVDDLGHVPGSPADVFNSVLTQAVMQNNAQIIQLLIKNGAQILVSCFFKPTHEATKESSLFDCAIENDCYAAAAVLVRNGAQMQKFLHRISIENCNDDLFKTLSETAQTHGIKILNIPEKLRTELAQSPGCQNCIPLLSPCIVKPQFSLIDYSKAKDLAPVLSDPEKQSYLELFTLVFSTQPISLPAEPGIHENIIHFASELGLNSNLDLDSASSPAISNTDLILKLLNSLCGDIQSYLAPASQPIFEEFANKFISRAIPHTTEAHMYAEVALCLVELKKTIKNSLENGMPESLLRQKLCAYSSEFSACHAALSEALNSLSLKIRAGSMAPVQERLAMHITDELTRYFRNYSRVDGGIENHVYSDGLYELFSLKPKGKPADEYSVYIDTPELLSMASRICKNFDQTALYELLGQDERFKIFIPFTRYKIFSPVSEGLVKAQGEIFAASGISPLHGQVLYSVLHACFGISPEAIEQIHKILNLESDSEIIPEISPEPLTLELLEELELPCVYGPYFPVQLLGKHMAKSVGLVQKKETTQTQAVFNFLTQEIATLSPDDLGLWRTLLTIIDGMTLFEKTWQAFCENNIENWMQATPEMIITPHPELGISLYDRLTCDAFVGAPLLLDKILDQFPGLDDESDDESEPDIVEHHEIIAPPGGRTALNTLAMSAMTLPDSDDSDESNDDEENPLNLAGAFLPPIEEEEEEELQEFELDTSLKSLLEISSKFMQIKGLPCLMQGSWFYFIHHFLQKSETATTEAISESLFSRGFGYESILTGSFADLFTSALVLNDQDDTDVIFKAAQIQLSDWVEDTLASFRKQNNPHAFMKLALQSPQYSDLNWECFKPDMPWQALLRLYKYSLDQFERSPLPGLKAQKQLDNYQYFEAQLWSVFLTLSTRTIATPSPSYEELQIQMLQQIQVLRASALRIITQRQVQLSSLAPSSRPISHSFSSVSLPNSGSPDSSSSPFLGNHALLFSPSGLPMNFLSLSHPGQESSSDSDSAGSESGCESGYESEHESDHESGSETEDDSDEGASPSGNGRPYKRSRP